MSNETSRLEIQHAFRARGVTIAAWAQANGFPAALVYAVLSGRSKGYRGKSYEIARALRLVSPDIGSDDRFDWLEKQCESAAGGGKPIRHEEQKLVESFEVIESTKA